MSRLYDTAKRVGQGPPRKGPVDQDSRFDELAEMFENPHLLDWPKALDVGQKLLDDGGLDLRALGYASAAAFRVDVWKGLTDAFLAWNHALDEAWEHAQPPDPRKRMPPTQRFVQTLHRWLVDAAQHARPGEADPIPAADTHEVMLACKEAGERFIELVELRFEGKARPPRDVVARIRAIEDEVRPKAAPPPPPPPPPPKAAPPKAAPPPEPTEDDAPLEEAPPPPPARRAAAPPPAPRAPAAPEGEVDEEALDDGLRKLREAVWPWADILRTQQPARPEAWRLLRDVAFATVSVPASGQFTVPDLPDVPELVAAVRAGNPQKLLEVAEDLWRRHVAWLDPHRHVSDALRKLGHEAAAEAVAQSTRDLARRLPELLEARYGSEGITMRPDGTVGKPDPVPLADADTRRWLDARPAAALPSAAPAGTAPGGPDLSAFDAALSAGKVGEALAAYTATARTVRAPRDQAWMAVHAARALIGAGKADLALPILLSMEELTARHDLDAWEPDLTAEILGNILTAVRVNSGGVGEERLAALRLRLVRTGDLRPLSEER